jgi:enoyl-CoA hydratase/carnithine racemase
MQQILSNTLDGVLTLTINRPEQKNAINAKMYAQLATEIERANQDKEIHCVLITGVGDTFTAGNDLQDFISPPKDQDLPAVRFLHCIAKIEKPLIAAVNGPAIGIGLTMLLHCDIVVAARSASFTAPFTRLGLVPEAASSMLLPELIGRALANDVLLAGRTLNSEEALTSGLISRLVDDAVLQQSAEQLAQYVASMPANAMRKSKSLINDKRRDKILKVMQDEFVQFAEQLASPEFIQAVQPLLKQKQR